MKIQRNFLLGTVVAIVGSACFAPTAGATTVFNETFEGYTLGNSNGQGGWVDFGGALTADVVNTHASSGSQSLKFSTSPGYGSDSTLDLGAPITSGQLSLSFDVFQTSTYDGNAHMYFSRGATLGNTFAQGMHFVGNGTAGTFKAGNAPTTALLVDQWVQVTLYIDLDAATAVATYGGTEVYNGTWMIDNPNPVVPTQYQGINIWADGGVVADSFYIDNLRLDTIPEPGGVALLGLSFAGLALRRRRA